MDSNIKRGIPLIWFQGVRPEAKSDFEGLLRNSSVVLSKLQEILESHLAVITETEESEEFYNDPNLTHRMAFNRGQASALKTILTLIDFINSR
jgi:hypothetical protein